MSLFLLEVVTFRVKHDLSFDPNTPQSSIRFQQLPSVNGCSLRRSRNQRSGPNSSGRTCVALSGRRRRRADGRAAAVRQTLRSLNTPSVWLHCCQNYRPFTTSERLKATARSQPEILVRRSGSEAPPSSSSEAPAAARPSHQDAAGVHAASQRRGNGSLWIKAGTLGA